MSNKLSLKQKQIIINLIHFEVKYNHNIKDEAYGETPAYKDLDRWLSEILNLDFRNDIYSNPTVTEINKVQSVKEKVSKDLGNWFIGDSLRDLVFTACYHNRNSPEDIKEVEKKVTEAWLLFKSLTPKIEEEKEDFEDTGLVLNGEKLYRKVVEK